MTETPEEADRRLRRAFSQDRSNEVVARALIANLLQSGKPEAARRMLLQFLEATEDPRAGALTEPAIDTAMLERFIEGGGL